MLWSQDKSPLWKLGIGASVLGAAVVGARYALRPQKRVPVPEDIAPPQFISRVAETTRGQLLYHESGSGQPLVFVHGIYPGASSFEWSRVYPQFASRYRVLALDLLGFGESERAPRNLTIEDQARALLEFILRVCPHEQPALIGSGLGGGFCALLASQHPERVKRLILLMPTGLQEMGQRRAPFGVRLAMRVPGAGRYLHRNYLGRKSNVRRWLEEYAFHRAERITPEVEQVMVTLAQQTGARHATLDLLSGRYGFNLAHRLDHLPHPVRLIWSREVQFPPLSWGQQYQKMMRNASLAILEDTGALAALETPDAVAEVIEEELRDDLRSV